MILLQFIENITRLQYMCMTRLIDSKHVHLRQQTRAPAIANTCTCDSKQVHVRNGLDLAEPNTAPCDTYICMILLQFI